MKIIDLKTVLLTGPCTHDPYLSQCRKRRSAAFVEIHTDTPHVGLGETYAGYFIPEGVPPIVDFFKPILIGQCVDDIRTLWQRMYHCGNFWSRVGLGVIVLTAIEAALWDLKGKLEQRPAYELLGGARHESLPCYATGGPSLWPKQHLIAQATHYLSLGFRALKVGAGVFDVDRQESSMPDSDTAIAELEAEKAETLRACSGADMGLMIDGHMGNSDARTWSVSTAEVVLRALQPFGLLFFEEPLHYTDLDGYEQLCKRVEVPIAGGECLSAMCEWAPFVDRNALDIAQPDASYVGGLGPFLEIAKTFERSGKQVATHAWGAGGSLMQNVHAGFACKNTLILEIPPAYGPLHSEIIGDSLVMRDGRILRPDRPGLGIGLTAETKARFPFVPGSGEFNSVPGKVLID